MNGCECKARHLARRIVLTGGPGAGKTAVLELVRRATCKHVRVLPEAAGIVFGGGFPRTREPALRKPAQRAIYHVQRELEETVVHEDLAVVLCDRGTIDGLAYWPGPEDMLQSVRSSLDAELARYHAVIHLRTPRGDSYRRDNPLRIENVDEAAAIDERIGEVWARHPRRFEIAAARDFMEKAKLALALISGELPDCCASERRDTEARRPP